MTFALSKILWFLLLPSNLMVLAIVVGLVVGLRKPHARTGLRLVAVGVTALLLGGATSLGSVLLLPLEQRFPAFEPAAGSRDFAGIIVLGGAEDGRISEARRQLHLNEAAERITEGARLARLLPSTRVAFTGGAALPILGNVSGADPVGQWWQAMGIAPERIVLEPVSRNTHENAILLVDLLKPKPSERWLLVTSAAHMPRAMGAFRRAGFDVTAFPVDFRTTGIGDLVDLSASLTGGLRRVDEATKEWMGLVAYWLLGRTSALFPAPRAASSRL
ncbi:MAG: YdcF family protein [Hyphomicrobiaceae bacterium]|nr:YdcF family protein [Hyphomicrobiaceae bacterium]